MRPHQRNQRYLRSVIAAAVMLSIIGSFVGFGSSLVIIQAYPELSLLETMLFLAGGTIVGWTVGLGIAFAALGGR